MSLDTYVDARALREVYLRGFEAAVQRDYPVIFGTLYVFGLLSLVVGILSDLMYVFVDPRIDFEKREV